MADFGRAKTAWFEQFLSLPNGIPAHDTFWRVLRFLDPAQFQACFLSWMQAISCVTSGEVVAIDGKKRRRSHAKGLGKAAIHMVSARASSAGLTLGQRKVDDTSNEITAIPELLQVLDLAGCIATMNVIGCQTEVAQAIVDKCGLFSSFLRLSSRTLGCAFNHRILATVIGRHFAEKSNCVESPFHDEYSMS